MKVYLFIGLFLLLASCNQQTISYKEISQRTDKSKAVIKDFGRQLKAQLQTAMKSGGPIAAISVCNEQAPLIAQELSKQTGWEIYRTSLKPRAKQPDAWEIRTMQSFEQRLKDGNKVKKLFTQDIVAVNEKATFRYMQAIETKQLCLLCHGENIAADVADKITELYPDDKATGFKLGDIRGAFSIIQSID
ncbi:MAG: DUF3365 domain-containing protein [Proteobacteria bacterium]|nr:DUF3365 domain-containing protein [Pseudomonadota bacterium]